MTEQAHDDLRVQRTRAALRQALLDALAEKPFERVTVRELAERAVINRATFYRHYRDKEDLAASIFEDPVEQLAADAGAPPGDFSAIDLTRPPEPWVALFRHVRSHEPLYRGLLRGRSWHWFTAVVRRKVTAVVERRVAATGGPRRPPLVAPDLGIAMVASALVGAIAWWLDQPEPLSPEDLAHAFLRFAALGYLDVMGYEAPARPGA